MYAKINLAKSTDACDRIARFAAGIQSGVTVYSTTGLLYSLLSDMDYEVVDEPVKEFDSALYAEGFAAAGKNISRDGIKYVAATAEVIGANPNHNEYGVGYITAVKAYKEGLAR